MHFYLLRYRRTNIYGPFSKSEVKERLKHESSVNDWEIAGHLGPWIFFKNEETLKHTYTELWSELNTPSFSWKSLFGKKK